MSDTSYDVVGIGNAIVDIIARCDEAFLSNHGMEKGFMQLIDAAQANELYAAMGPAQAQSGGSVANSCAGIASFGGKCGFIGRVAGDQFGKVFAHDIRAIGVAYDTPASDAGLPGGGVIPFLIEWGTSAHPTDYAHIFQAIKTLRRRVESSPKLVETLHGS